MLQFALAAAAIVIAGSFLTRAADRIAELTGFGRLLIGAVLLAGAGIFVGVTGTPDTRLAFPPELPVLPPPHAIHAGRA